MPKLATEGPSGTVTPVLTALPSDLNVLSGSNPNELTVTVECNNPDVAPPDLLVSLQSIFEAVTSM